MFSLRSLDIIWNIIIIQSYYQDKLNMNIKNCCKFMHKTGRILSNIVVIWVIKAYNSYYYVLVVQGETELSFRLIPSLAKITSSLTVLVRGFVWHWVKEGMNLKDNSVSPCMTSIFLGWTIEKFSMFYYLFLCFTWISYTSLILNPEIRNWGFLVLIDFNLILLSEMAFYLYY